jgi:hypothetical protein
MIMDERVLRAMLRFLINKEDLAQVKAGSESIETALSKVQKQAEATQKSMMKLREGAEKLQSISLTIGAAGAGMAAPFLLAASKYVTATKDTEESSARWLKANERIEQSTQRIGKVAVQAILPVLEQVAGLAEKAATFAEKNPDAVKGILTVAGALVGIGALGSLAAQGIKLYATSQALAGYAQQLLAGKLMQDAANKQLAASKAGAGGALGGILGKGLAVAGGVTAGAGIYDALRPQGALNAGQIVTGLLGLPKALIAGIAGGSEAAAKSMQDTKRAMDAMGDQAGETAGQVDGATGKLKLSADKMQSLQATYAKYLDEGTKADQDHLATEAQTRNDFAAEDAKAWKDHRAEEVRDAAALYKELSQQESGYYRERAQMARDAGTEELRAEEDHQRSMDRAREDHNEKVEDMVRSGDAKGIYEEIRSYEKERRRSDEDNQVEVSRRRQDLATALADRAAQFEAERQQAIEQAAQRQAERDVQFVDERKAAAEQNKQKLNELDRQYAAERQQRYQALVQAFQDELGLRAQFNSAVTNGTLAMIATVQAAFDNFNSGPQGSRETGGYVSQGLWQMHNDEFVLNRRTARAAETMAGRRLDQQTMLALMGSGRAVTYNDQRRFDSRLSVADRRAIQQDTAAILEQVIKK